MSHEIETIDGKASIAYAASSGKPWHGLGTAGDASWDLNRWGRESGIFYNVDKRPSFFQDKTGAYKPNGTFSIVRDVDESFYGTCSDNWQPLQNRDALELFQLVTKVGNASIETVGSLRSGRIMWVLAKVEGGDFTLLKKDRVESYMLLFNPHIVGRAWGFAQTAIRVVCHNTYMAAMNSGVAGSLRFTHLQTKAVDLQALRDEIARTAEGLTTFKAQATRLAKRRAKDADVVDYFKRVFCLKELPGGTAGEKAANARTQRQVASLKELLVTQPGADLGAGTWWQAFNAVTHYTDHIAGKTPDARLSSAWFGLNAARKQQAMSLALEMAR